MEESKKLLVMYVKSALHDVNKAIQMYEKASFEAQDPVVKNFYESLTDEKKNHYKYIQRFYLYIDKKKDLDELQKEIESDKEDNRSIFSSDFVDRINKQQGVIGALSLAIEHEKKAMNYYQQLFKDTDEKVLKRFFEMMFNFQKQNFKDFYEIFEAYEEHTEGLWE